MVGNLKTSAELVDRVNEGLQHSDSAKYDLLCFSKLFLAEMNEEDCVPFSQSSLLALVNEAFQYIQKRPSNAHKIRAFDIKTDVAANGLNGSRTIIEILNDDMPFLVDSIMGELTEQQLKVHLVLHPILHTIRNGNGDLQSVLDNWSTDYDLAANRPAGYLRESFIHIQIEEISDQRKKDLVTCISSVLESVRLAVADWRAMLLKVTETSAAYAENPPPVDVITLTESLQFLKWLTENHFTFLGTREYELIGGMEDGYLKPIEGSALGILRDPDIHILRTIGKNKELTDQNRTFFISHEPLTITKANIRSTIHRRVHMDYVGIKQYDSSGEICGELRIVGLFTSAAYTRLPINIPFIRHKVETVLRRYGQSRSAYGSKTLQNVLDTFPRDELFQISIDKLYETATGIVALDLQPRPRVFIRMDEFNRFASVLVYVPRDSFATDSRIAIGEYLAKNLGGRVSAFHPFFTEGPMVRIQFIIGLSGDVAPKYNEKAIEQQVVCLLRNWRDELKVELNQVFLPSKAGNLLYKYGSAFPAGYEELTTPHRAIQDIQRMEYLNEEDEIAISFYRDEDSAEGEVRASIYHMGGPISLSERVPILENLGFSVIDERTFRVVPGVEDKQESVFNLHDMVLRTRDGKDIDLLNNSKRLEDGFLAVWNGLAEDDVYNNLIAILGIDWREVSMIRALGAYLRQLGEPFSKRYLGQTLVHNSAITRNLIELFRLRFDPATGKTVEERQEKQEELVKLVEQALVAIPSLDEDRILRHYLDLVKSILRTNFYQLKKNGQPPETISFKFDSRRIEAVPHPKPFAEIYVFSPRVEGIHLRGGKIARGGLRWSDRRQDFRTEVLGLAKAQQVKNSVIVPTGAKGGFVPKKLRDDATREQRMAEGIDCYKLFVSSLLSITDNLVGREVRSPEKVVCHDGQDPYLVVAADKGTATFSDIANQISQEAGFWLGDAFASGGSAGYDHKKMAITARGAWESVKRHFREMDRDIQTEPFTVVGIGDMSGDVFGNGMLLSKTTRLVAAFDHRDIFIDPDPSEETGWLERKRLFELERSSWQDYNPELISEGGGIFSRQSKSIELSQEIKKLTGLTENRVPPNKLISALLRVEVDLLWFGGIGTYVCAEGERDEEVGDRANDALRVRASELQAKVVGEGANLAMTQRARIAFALNGGRVNSDAIDNSAGVNSSDLEVNIKIALGERVRSGKMTLPERDKLLARMTNEVAEACLRNNYLQSLTISLGERRGLEDLSFQKRLINSMEKTGFLNRKLEYLPTDSELSVRARNGKPLTRPELAVLLAYSKIDLFNRLVESSVPDDEFLDEELFAYFPATLVREAPEEIKNHRLRREIIATRLSNAVINRGGSTMIVRLKEETGHRMEDIAYAFVAACAVFDLESVYDEIDALDNRVSGDIQLSLYSQMQNLVRSQTTWFLHNMNLGNGLSHVIETYRKGLETLDQSIEQILNESGIEELKAERRKLEDDGVSDSLSSYIAGLKFLANGPDIILVSTRSERNILHSAKAFSQVDELFDLREMRKQTARLGYGDYFDRIAVNSALRDISSIQRQISEQVLKVNPGENIDIANWTDSRRDAVERTQQLISDILRTEELTIAKLTVGVSQLRQLC